MGKDIDYRQISKGFTSMLKDWNDILAQRNEIKINQIENDMKMKQNWMYKILEQNAERQNKLQFIKEAQQQFGNQEDGMGMETAPQMRVGAGGEPTLHYESPRETEAKINLGRKYIKTKQLRYAQTGDEKFKPTERDLAFLEKYPEDIWGKEQKEEGQPFELKEGIKIPEGYERVGFNSTTGNPIVKKVKTQKEKERIDKNKITPLQALNIISDPFKSQQLKRYYPDLYKRVESIAKQEENRVMDTDMLSPLPEQKSPYPEYPDAFLEDGVWKVMQNGKKYKIQE